MNKQKKMSLSTLDFAKKTKIRSKRNQNVRNHEKPLNASEMNLIFNGKDDENENNGNGGEIGAAAANDEFNPEFSFHLDSLTTMDSMEGSEQFRGSNPSFTDKYLKDVTVRNLI